MRGRDVVRQDVLGIALALVAAAGSARAQVVINTTAQTITGDTDGLSSSFNGTAFRAFLDNGVAVFAIKGDLVLPVNQSVTITGSRPCRILVGNNLIMVARQHACRRRLARRDDGCAYQLARRGEP